MHHRTPIVAIAIGISVITLAACGSDRAKVNASNDGKITVSQNGKGEQATISGDGNTVTFGGTKVPAGFPTAVPQPANAKLRGVASGARGSGKYFQLDYTLSGSAAEVATAYRKQLENAGFTVTDGGGPASGAAPLLADGHGWKLVVLTIPGSPATLSLNVTNG